MTQVSRIRLPKAVEDQMHGALRKALADLRTEEEVGEFLEDLLTPTEKIMLGKRLAIAILLDKGYDQRTIHSIMKVSVTTVSSVNYWLKQRGKGYRRVIDKMKSQEQWKQFTHELGKFLEDYFTVHGQLRKLRKF
ncbi:hypothetical protein A2875_03705 [Candidatus Gottesmanbacteria bacterium RIFCSPHIGHO2_01_FULL_46_14]|uniref:TrpR like protein, YerC/YecD n=3 Tax=Candidatus Gottesmaniibacteriota TaxID=1752720 RepID=A0A1F5ZN34_9BACT|nr:MAG: TrpR like protein, YerC/YecD [Candidatus Gottesmanbacteria bacterium GW2011_GWA1_47_8]OGG13848.1 MAG: hypothetical protein A2875_03705 [Candidatus Gottesmanbacteria bacterium RIFCSPHIGHO2_01_FULL_46_14]OGG29602.1 MAG: hypothetical protein A2971_01000 [Candidatus Gottesmanbacteria bacterium RIFCSPLOWO2_01_FULL_46_21]